MKILKKSLSIFMAIAMLLSMVPMFASAATVPVFSLNRVSEDNSTIVVSVNLESGSFTNGTFRITYQGNVNRCTKISKGSALKAAEDYADENGEIIAYAPNSSTAMVSVASTGKGMSQKGEYFLFTLQKKTSAEITRADVNLKVADTDAKVWNKISGSDVKYVSVSDIELNAKKKATIVPEIIAEEGAEYTVEFKSLNPKVATVDNNGVVYGVKNGSATITCSVTDSFGEVISDSCNVKVKYTFGQWLLVILLFGWIWY